MTNVLIHELDYGNLESLKVLCVRTRKCEGLSERYWRARAWLTIELQRLEGLRFQQTCEAVTHLGKRLESYNGRSLKPSLVS